MSHFQDSLFSNCGQIIKTKRNFLKTESKSALLFVQTQHLIIYFCQSLLGSGQGRQHPASVGRQTHLKKGKHARTHTRTHLRQSQNCCYHGNVKVEFSQCGKIPHVAPHKSRQTCCGLLGGTFVRPVAPSPTSPSQTGPPCLHTEALLSCIVV